MKIRFVLFSVICFALGPMAQAQPVSVKVPFAFVISDRVYPAGDYSLSSSRDKLIIQDSAGKTISISLSNAISGRHVGNTGEIVFHCYTNRCFLSELWTPTSDIGRQLLPSHAEIETAKNNTQTYFALMGIPATRK